RRRVVVRASLKAKPSLMQKVLVALYIFVILLAIKPFFVNLVIFVVHTNHNVKVAQFEPEMEAQIVSN
ncbi:MAG TPA: hypothetical protein P5132_10470, partial [Bacteroidales bacterium]|nr:hypothetical protein [Bacteroidales bacterium]